MVTHFQQRPSEQFIAANMKQQRKIQYPLNVGIIPEFTWRWLALFKRAQDGGTSHLLFQLLGSPLITSSFTVLLTIIDQQQHSLFSATQSKSLAYAYHLITLKIKDTDSKQRPGNSLIVPVFQNKKYFQKVNVSFVYSRG